jgi:hypothetical protein
MGAMIRVSALPKTWIFDLDGCLVVHCGHLGDGDRLLPGVREWMAQIPASDRIVLLSAREECYRESSLAFLRGEGIRIDHAVFGLPVGERILFNDRKPQGLDTALAVNLPRDAGPSAVAVECDPAL